MIIFYMGAKSKWQVDLQDTIDAQAFNAEKWDISCFGGRRNPRCGSEKTVNYFPFFVKFFDIENVSFQFNVKTHFETHPFTHNVNLKLCFVTWIWTDSLNSFHRIFYNIWWFDFLSNLNKFWIKLFFHDFNMQQFCKKVSKIQKWVPGY